MVILGGGLFLMSEVPLYIEGLSAEREECVERVSLIVGGRLKPGPNR